jgi:cathepsin B
MTSLRAAIAAITIACAVSIPIPWTASDFSTTEPAIETVNDAREIERINTHIKSWEAGVNAFFHNWTMSDAKKLLGTVLDHEFMHELPEKTDYPVMDVPDSFDSRTNWPNLIHPIRDQQRCGSCWAFAASEVLSDRFAISTKKASPVLSPQDLVSCDSTDMGCQGGFLPKAWAYLKDTGIVTDTCEPYTSGSGSSGTCLKKCSDGEPYKKYKAKDAYQVKGVANIQKEIMQNGPVEVAFKVYGDFMKYKSGVYHKAWWEFVPKGGHAVKMIGWGTENGQDYWLVANSWNTNWGDQGFFKIRRGHDECGIESQVFAGHPAV